MSDLEKRLIALEDIEAIKKLKARYLFGCDARCAESIKACFADKDLLLDFGFIGKFTAADKFIEVFTALTSKPSQIDLHHGFAPEIEITGSDSATGRWRLSFQQLETEAQLVQFMGGYYEDEYIKSHGEWRIKTSKFTLLSNLLLEKADAEQLRVMQLGSDAGLVAK